MMSGGRPRTNPVDAALARLADLAGRGVKPARMEREVEAIVAAWLGVPGPADSDVVAERLAALHEQLAAGTTDAAEQLADVDRSDGAAQRHAGLVHAALVAAVAAVERAQEAQHDRPSAHAAVPVPRTPEGEQAAVVVARPLRSPPGHAVTIDPLAGRNPHGVDHDHPDEVRAESAAATPASVPPARSRPSKKRTTKKMLDKENTLQNLLD